MRDFDHPPQTAQDDAEAPRRSRAIWWLWGGFAAVIIIGCGGVIAFISYVGAYSPDTSIYTGNRIPTGFLRTIENVGALEDGEKIIYFYSDAFGSIRDGFYFVSDRKVAIYSEATGDSPLIAIPFEEIADVEIYRNESFLDDSEITLFLEDGQVISFPVSSENDRDEQFFNVIRDRTAKGSDRG